MDCSISRRRRRHNDAVAEPFCQLLKRERITRKIYATPADATSEVFNYIEMF